MEVYKNVSVELSLYSEQEETPIGNDRHFFLAELHVKKKYSDMV